MNELPFFLLCEDPNDEEERLYITRTGNPYVLAEVFFFDVSDAQQLAMAQQLKQKTTLGGSFETAEVYGIVQGHFYSFSDPVVDSKEVADRLATAMREICDYAEKCVHEGLV